MPISLVLTIIKSSALALSATISSLEVFIKNQSVVKVLDEAKAFLNELGGALGGVTSEFNARVAKGAAQADDAHLDGIDIEEHKDKA